MPEKTCFVIAPIGVADSETRKRSDQVLKHIIRPAVRDRGYRAVRADEIAEPGMITTQVIQHIVDAPLVIADLTERNPNVFYELAVRHALRKPLVQIISKGEAIPFDVSGMRTVSVDHHDLDSVETAIKEIGSQIEALEKPGARIETPISVAVNLQSLKDSDDPERRTLAELLGAIGDLRSAVASIEQRLAEQDARSRFGSLGTSHSWRVSEMTEDLKRSLEKFVGSPLTMDEFELIRERMVSAPGATTEDMRRALRELRSEGTIRHGRDAKDVRPAKK